MKMDGRRTSAERWRDNLSGVPPRAAGLLRALQQPRLATERELARLQGAVELLSRTPAPTRSAYAPAGGGRTFGTRPSRAVVFAAFFLLTVSMVGSAPGRGRPRRQRVRQRGPSSLTIGKASMR